MWFVDLKQIKLEDYQADGYMEKPFFVKHNSKKLPRLQNYKNSLLFKVGQVTQIPGFNLTMLRNSVESRIQMRNKNKDTSKVVNSHGAEVGKKTYDKMSSTRRSLFINNLNVIESSSASANNYEEYKASEDIERNRADMDLQEYERLVIVAKR